MLTVDSGFVILTEEIFQQGMSGNGGFTYAQAELLGAETPLRRGWKSSLIGKKIPREIAEQFIALKGVKKKQRRASSQAALPVFTEVSDPLMWSEQYKHPNWQKMRLWVLNRDNFTCQKCGSHHQQLHVHHTAYARNGYVWDVDPRTLTTLCDDCHSAEHGRRF